MFSDLKELLHHAYIIEGSLGDPESIFNSISKKLNVERNSQDFFLLQSSMFGVDDANRIVEINSRKAFGKGNKAIVITADTFSHQAQNALLKTLEEPTPGTYFFILTSTASTFLPTILSRVHILRSDSNSGKDTDRGSVLSPKWTGCELPSVTDFIRATGAKRLSLIKEIIKQKENEKIHDGDIFVFIRALESESFSKTKGTEKEIEVAKVFTKVEGYMRDTSSSKKMLLEYVALKLPF